MSGRLVETEVLRRGYVTLLKAVVEAPDGGRQAREITDHGQAVAFLPYDADRRVAMLVSLPRAPVLHQGVGEDLLEAPAGMIDDEDAQASVRREALEETGLKLGALEPVARVWPSPGVSTERVGLYLAPYAAADRVARGGGAEDEQENITVRETPLAELAALADAGELTDMKTLTLVSVLRLRRPELFETG